MKSNGIFLNKYSDLVLRHGALKVAVIALSVVCVYQQKHISDISSSQFTVITPATVTREMKISSSKADSAYMIEMSRMLVDLYASVSAGNVDKKFSELLKLAAPDTFPKLRERLKQRSDLIKRYSSISYYADLNDTPDIKFTSNELTINGVLRKVVGNDIERATPVTFLIKYRINFGKFELIDIIEVKE